MVKTDPFLQHNKWIQWLSDKLFDPRKYFVVSPWCHRIGHLSYEIQIAASIAKRDNKLLVLIPGWRPVNKEIFNCEFDCEVHNNKSVKFHLLYIMYFMSYFVVWFFNSSRNKIGKYFPFILKISHRLSFHPMIGIEKGNWWRYRIKGTEYYYDFKTLIEQRIQARLNPKQLRKGEKLMREMGVPENCWFICLHVREQGYLGPWSHHKHRDINVMNYLPAIKYINKRGGYIVRLGDPSMKPLPQMQGVIDYALSDYRSGLMDLYLISKCKFFLSCDSGPASLAWLFDKPICSVNLADTSIVMHDSDYDVIVPKHVFSTKKGRIFSFKELINSDIFNVDLPTDEYIFIENTPNEILNTVIDYFDLLENLAYDKWNIPLQEEIKRTIRGRYKYFVSQNWTDDGKKDYWAGRYYNTGLVGKYYLNKCWEYSTYLEKLSSEYKSKNNLN